MEFNLVAWSVCIFSTIINLMKVRIHGSMFNVAIILPNCKSNHMYICRDVTMIFTKFTSLKNYCACMQ